MAATQPSLIEKSRQLELLVALPGAPLQLAGILLVLSFAVLTSWVPGRWPDAGVRTGIFLLGIAAAGRAAFWGAKCGTHWLQIPFAAAVLLGLARLAANLSVYRFETGLAILHWLAVLVAFSAAYQVFTHSQLRRGLSVYATYFGGFISVWAILQLASPEGRILWMYAPPDAGSMGPYLNYDHYSALIELLFPIALWEAIIDRRRTVQFGFIAATMYVSVIASTSRAGSVLVTLELAAILIPVLTRAVGKRRSASRLGLGLLTLAAIVSWDSLLQRFQSNDAFAGLTEIWRSGGAMIREHPWLGSGLGTWVTAYPPYAVVDLGSVENAPHSDWLQWAGEGGIPFAGLLLLVAGRSLYLGLKMPWGLGVFFVFAHSLVSFSLQTTSIILWTVVVLAALEAGLPKEAPEPS